MDQAIYKWTLDIEDKQTLSLPAGAQILSVAMQRDEVCLWALIDPKATKVQDRTFEIFGTGHPIPQGIQRKFLGTVLTHGGALVWHVFERI